MFFVIGGRRAGSQRLRRSPSNSTAHVSARLQRKTPPSMNVWETLDTSVLYCSSGLTGAAEKAVLKISSTGWLSHSVYVVSPSARITVATGVENRHRLTNHMTGFNTHARGDPGNQRKLLACSAAASPAENCISPTALSDVAKTVVRLIRPRSR